MSVRVAVRFRPDLVTNNDNEPDEIEQNLLIYPQLNCVNVARHFNLYFHDVLPLYSTQDEVFNIVQPLVDDFLQGNNISVITYGPSGCGKTYTMFGNGGTQTNPENVYRLGLMPRVISYIFDQLQQRFNPMNGQFIYQLQCTFAEIHNKKIIDLLNPYHHHRNKNSKKKVKFIQKQNGSYDYQNLTKVTISSIADVLRFMYQAFHNRKYVRKYAQNGGDYKNKYKQSKSHCVATLKLIFKKKDTNELYKVSMVFIDCGAYCKSGSRTNMSPTSTSTSSTTSITSIDDWQYINRAFLSLGNVVTGLHRTSQENERNINWKDNILTQTLHSLCTSSTPSKMLLFLNCSLSASLYGETLATLRFGNLAMTDPMLLNVMDNYRKKIKSLQAKISKYKNKYTINSNDNISVTSSHESSSGNNEKLKAEMNKIKNEKKLMLKELNSLRLQNNENSSVVDYKNSQIAAMDLSIIQLKNELLKLQTNEELLRDENKDLHNELDEINSVKRNKLQFIDNNLMKRTSVIHSTLKRGMINKNTIQSQMIDELSSQIEDLENLKAELTYKLSTKDEKILQLSQQQQQHKKDILCLRQDILTYKTNYILKSTADIEQYQLLQQIKERDCRIADYERDIKENLYESSNWKDIQKTYEQTIQQLQQQVKESKQIIQQQHEQYALGHLGQSSQSTQQAQTNEETIENNQDIVDKYEEEMRNLKLKIARMESAVYKNEQIAKLKRKNNVLEERLIKARSKKAKMLPTLLREKTQLKSELIEMKTTLALYLVKCKFIEKKYVKQIRDCTSDLERYRRKLDNQIKGKRKLGNQMEMLDKLAQDTVKSAVHQRIISSMPNTQLQNNSGNIFDIPDHDQKQQANNNKTNHLTVYNNNAPVTAHATLPENLQRVQNVITDLTTKLQKKQTRITELENKMALFEYSISRTSGIGNVGSVVKDGGGSMVGMSQLMSDGSVSFIGMPSIIPQIGQNDGSTFNMFSAFSSTTTDLQQNMQHIPEKLRLSQTEMSTTMAPEPNEYKEHKEHKEQGNLGDQSMLQNQEEYLKAFLTNQVKTALPPTPEKTLSLGFFINKTKNIRISIDVNMTFYDILNELSVKQPSDLDNLELHIEQNPDPIESTIIVTNELMNKSFWDLILEFGMFSLLKFSVITNAVELKKNTLQIQSKNAKKTSIFKRFKSKKSVSK